MAGDRLTVFLKREVAAVEKVQFGLAKIALIRLRAFDGEEGVVLAPDDQDPGLMIAEIGVPLVIERDVRRVVVEKIKLDPVVAGTIEEMLVEGVGVGIDAIGIMGAMSVLEISWCRP